ncbi:putative membrane protein [Escherichia coli 2-156-04_S3_C2]|nr:putative membrane protein [Escherichia coli 2-156-04_S3_C2]
MERFREDLAMNGKRMFALAFAIAMAIAVNVALFGGLYLLVNP